MTVKITWFRIDEEALFLWSVNRGLYAYSSPEGEILYIGKMNGKTVRERFQPAAKPDLWNFIENELGHSDVNVLVGIISLPEGCRHSRQLLSDIESLLIYEIKPPGNIACRTTRITRPGLIIRCHGNWTYSRRAFVDK